MPHGPARRLTIHGRTVAGFHLFGVDDTEDARQGAIVIYHIDIWVDDFPSRPVQQRHFFSARQS